MSHDLKNWMIESGWTHGTTDADAMDWAADQIERLTAERDNYKRMYDAAFHDRDRMIRGLEYIANNPLTTYPRNAVNIARSVLLGEELP